MIGEIYIIRDGFHPLRRRLFAWWKISDLLLSNQQMEWVGMMGDKRQLRLWVEGQTLR